MAECSQLAKLLTDMAMIHATNPDVHNLDDVVGMIQKDFPLVRREDLVDAIIESSRTQAKEVDDLTKKLTEIRREARSDKALRDKIKEYENYLKTGKAPKTARKIKDVPAEIQALREIRDSLRRQISRSEPARAERLQKSIDLLEKKLETGDILPKPRIELPETKQLEMLNYKKNKLQNEIRYRIQQLKPTGFWEKVATPWNAFRALMTGGEFSLVLRQGGWTAVSRPKTVLKSLPGMFKAFASEKVAFEINEEINNRPNAPLYQKVKLHISPLDGILSKQEEVYMSYWIDKIPLIQNFQRAGVTFLNQVRADSFDLLSKTLPMDANGIANTDELKAIANYINVNTGRGSLGKAEQNAVTLNTIFFAPRYVSSRFQLLLGQPLWKGTANTRKIIAGEYARALTGIFAVMALGALAGGKIEDDPRSSDFGKIRFGKTRVDPLFGLSQTAVVLSRIISGKMKTQKGLRPIRGEDIPYGGKNVWDVSSDFLRTKFSPMLSTTFDFLVGQDVVGREVNVKNYISRLITPLAYRDIYEVFQDQDISHSAAMSMLVMFGVGLQTYGKPIDTWTEQEIRDEIYKYTYKKTSRKNNQEKGDPHKGKEEYIKVLEKELSSR